MSFLTLVQDGVRLASISDSGPGTVVDQTGDYLKMVNYTAMAYQEICNLHFDWGFLWGTSSIETEPEVSVYDGHSSLGIWDKLRFFYDGSPFKVIDWQDYIPEERDNGAPLFGVIRPDNKLLIVPTPDDEYTISYDYFKAAPALTANADEPLFPARFQKVIVGRALIYYGNFEAAEDAKIQGQELYQMFLAQLENFSLPRKQQTHGRHEGEQIVVVAE